VDPAEAIASGKVSVVLGAPGVVPIGVVVDGHAVVGIGGIDPGDQLSAVANLELQDGIGQAGGTDRSQQPAFPHALRNSLRGIPVVQESTDGRDAPPSAPPECIDTAPHLGERDQTASFGFVQGLLDPPARRNGGKVDECPRCRRAGDAVDAGPITRRNDRRVARPNARQTQPFWCETSTSTIAGSKPGMFQSAAAERCETTARPS